MRLCSRHGEKVNLTGHGTWDDVLVRVSDFPRPRIVSRAIAMFLSLFLVVTLSSCAGSGVRISVAPGELPELRGEALARDVAARTEAAAAERAAHLAARAASCDSCRQALDAVTASSRQRLEVLGGLWDPWQGEDLADAELPAPPTAAPFTVEDFTSWLVASAERDWAVAANADISADLAYALAGAAAGRYVSATRLASVYGIPLTQGDAHMWSSADRVASRAQHSDEDGTGWGLDGSSRGFGDDWPQSMGAPSSLAGDTRSAEAVRVWDCASQGLARAEVVDGTLKGSEGISDELLLRIDRTLGAGVPDKRSFRCSLGSDPKTIATALLNADLSLVGSSSPAVRSVGIYAFREDLRRWLPIVPSVAGDPLVGTTPLDTPQSHSASTESTNTGNASPHVGSLSTSNSPDTLS